MFADFLLTLMKASRTGLMASKLTPELAMKFAVKMSAMGNRR
jgi:hypothetical protein